MSDHNQGAGPRQTTSQTTTRTTAGVTESLSADIRAAGADRANNDDTIVPGVFSSVADSLSCMSALVSHMALFVSVTGEAFGNIGRQLRDTVVCEEDMIGTVLTIRHELMLGLGQVAESAPQIVLGLSDKLPAAETLRRDGLGDAVDRLIHAVSLLGSSVIDIQGTALVLSRCVADTGNTSPELGAAVEDLDQFARMMDAVVARVSDAVFGRLGLDRP